MNTNFELKEERKKRFGLVTKSEQLLADTITPVQLYLKLRDIFPCSILLESSDHIAHENSRSIIALEPIAGFVLEDQALCMDFPDGSRENMTCGSKGKLMQALKAFVARFELEGEKEPLCGLYGYFSYDAIPHFEDIKFKPKGNKQASARYHFYRYLIIIDHFHNALRLVENDFGLGESRLDELKGLIQKQDFPAFDFQTVGEKTSNMTDDAYLEMVKKGIQHCQRGDVFQIVLSRKFSQAFKGDEFNVYRSLRMVNPSPYLFYFDYGSYKLFGSSPEAQLLVEGRNASLNPIAGTYRRTGDDSADQIAAEKLAKDPKENAEHVMLVDLARNDLGKVGKAVKVERYRELQFFSHVIHLVSKVQCKLNEGVHALDAFEASFPAGTLSGAPKYKAMELIDVYEPDNRGFYGGSIGFIGLNGDLNQAIFIRSFSSQNNRLNYQAGAGIVAASNPKSELQEVTNKLAALDKAIQFAQTIKA